MGRAYSQPTQNASNARETHSANAGDESDRSLLPRAAVATSAQAMPAREHAATTAGVNGHPQHQSQPLNLKALRLAVHGWWLGNPLVYKPGVADLMAVARELAGAGAASGTLVLSDRPFDSDRSASAGLDTSADPLLIAEARSENAVHVFRTVHAVLILRPPTLMSLTPLGVAAAQATAEVAQAALGRPCTVNWRWQVVLRDGGRIVSRLCRVSVERSEEFALVDVRLAFDQLWQAAPADTDLAVGTLFARSDWREVFLARVLHTLDGRLRALHVA